MTDNESPAVPERRITAERLVDQLRFFLPITEANVDGLRELFNTAIVNANADGRDNRRVRSAPDTRERIGQAIDKVRLSGDSKTGAMTLMREELIDALVASAPDTAEVAKIEARCLADHPHVGRSPGIFGGRWIVGGIRIAVTDILCYLWQGHDVAYIANVYGLSEVQIKDAIAFAQDFIEQSDNRGAELVSDKEK